MRATAADRGSLPCHAEVLAAWAKIPLSAEAAAVFEMDEKVRQAEKEKERKQVAKLRVIKGDTPDTARAVGRPNPPKVAEPVKPKARLVFSSSDEESDDDLFG